MLGREETRSCVCIKAQYVIKVEIDRPIPITINATQNAPIALSFSMTPGTADIIRMI